MCFSLSKWTQAPNVTGCPTLLMKNNRSPCQKPARCSNFKTCFSCTSSVPLTGQGEKAKALPRCNAPQVQHSPVLPCGAGRPGPVAPTATGLRSTEQREAPPSLRAAELTGSGTLNRSESTSSSKRNSEQTERAQGRTDSTGPARPARRPALTMATHSRPHHTSGG